MNRPVPLSRRGFLRGTGLAALAACGPGRRLFAAAPEPTDPPRVGATLNLWRQEAERSGAALDLGAIADTLRETGYDYLEGRLDLERPAAASELAALLRARGLQPFSLYVGATLHESASADATVERLLSAVGPAAGAGFRVLVCNPEAARPAREKMDAELRVQAAALARLGRGLGDRGMRLAVHNHKATVGVRGRELRSNFDRTPAGLVGWCYDVDWVRRGGLDPSEVQPDYGDRIVEWHLRQTSQGRWLEDLEAGDIDYVAIARMAAARGWARNYSVELALEADSRLTRSIREDHRISREFVRRVFGV